MAIRIWDAYGLRCRWVPHNGGARAIAALLGGQGVAYVGNPGDAAHHPDLRVSIVSRPNRLEQLPDTPTFAEMGHPELDQQFMWRGFALPPGCPSEVRAWYHRLFRQVSDDAQWRDHWQQDGIEVVCVTDRGFIEVIDQTRAEFNRYLHRLHVAPVEGGPWIDMLSRGTTLAGVAIANLLFALAFGLRRTGSFWQRRLIPLAVLSVCVPLLAQTWTFPAAWEGVGAAALPRLWLIGTSLCALLTLVQPGTKDLDRATESGIVLVALLMAIVVGQWWAAGYVGYFPSAFLGTLASLTLLGERRWSVLLSVSAGWLVCAYLLFQRLLHVNLPTGSWFS
jgi:hypothetical protein